MTKQQKINIQTYYDPKPIPIRRFDWEAVDYDTLDYDSVTGFGATKEEAVADLMERLDDIKRQTCLLYTSPSPRDRTRSRMPSSA